MKKCIALALAALMLLALAACGGTPANPQNDAAGDPPVSDSSEKTDTNSSAGPAAAKDGTLTLSKADIAVVVNGTSVPMPYNLKALEAAGVPADESRSGIELGAGDFFSANLYLDENEDYLLIPAYYNGGESSVSITEAEAEEITMTTYADEPEDQGVSILGVSFGMARSEVKALLGEPLTDSGDYLEWHVEVPDMSYEGTLFIYVTADADDAGVSQVDLTVFEK